MTLSRRAEGPVSARPVHYVDRATVDEVWHDEEDVPQRSDDPVKCAPQSLRLAKQTAEVDEETTDGPGKKPDPTYVHVAKSIPPEEAMIAVSAVEDHPRGHLLSAIPRYDTPESRFNRMIQELGRVCMPCMRDTESDNCGNSGLPRVSTAELDNCN